MYGRFAASGGRPLPHWGGPLQRACAPFGGRARPQQKDVAPMIARKRKSPCKAKRCNASAVDTAGWIRKDYKVL